MRPKENLPKLPKKWLVLVMAAVIVVAAVYITINLPPHSQLLRPVQADPAAPPYYNNATDELTVWINCTPFDNYMYLSRITIPNTDYETVHHEPLHENGTVIQIVLADYSTYVGTPFPGLEIQLYLYFSDINTNVKVACVKVHMKYPG